MRITIDQKETHKATVLKLNLQFLW